MLQIYFVQAKYYIEQFYIVVNISKETNMGYLTGMPTHEMLNTNNQFVNKVEYYKPIEPKSTKVPSDTFINKEFSKSRSPKALAFESLLEGNLHGSAFLKACETAEISETTASIFVQLVKIAKRMKG